MSAGAALMKSAPQLWLSGRKKSKSNASYYDILDDRTNRLLELNAKQRII